MFPEALLEHLVHRLKFCHFSVFQMICGINITYFALLFRNSL